MFKTGDAVRVIPNSYINLAKGWFNSRERWFPSSPETDNYLMLGGRYNVLSKYKSNNQEWFVLLKNNEEGVGSTLESFLVSEKDFQRCPYNVGDKLKLRLDLLGADRAYLSALDSIYSINDPQAVHEVTYILNDYYVFLDYPKDSDYTYPFRWVDFVRCNNRKRG